MNPDEEVQAYFKALLTGKPTPQNLSKEAMEIIRAFDSDDEE